VLAILNTQNPHECFAQFQEAVASANEIQMNTPAANRARELLAEAEAYRRQIDAEAAEQVQKLEEPAMKDVLSRADAVGYTSEHLEKIRTLLYDTAEDSFVKMQVRGGRRMQRPHVHGCSLAHAHSCVWLHSVCLPALCVLLCS